MIQEIYDERESKNYLQLVSFVLKKAHYMNSIGGQGLQGRLEKLKTGRSRLKWEFILQRG